MKDNNTTKDSNWALVLMKYPVGSRFYHCGILLTVVQQYLGDAAGTKPLLICDYATKAEEIRSYGFSPDNAGYLLARLAEGNQ